MRKQLNNFKSYFLLFIVIIWGFSKANAQTITGTVKDKSGSALSNVLVVSVKNPSRWTKTTSDGTFSIQAGVGDVLKIAALRYQTIPQFKITSSAVSVTLDSDVLLQTDVYHISFDHLRPGASYSEVELKKDFPVANGIGFADGIPENDRASVDITESVDPKGASLKVKFPKGVLKTSSSGIDVRVPIEGSYKDNTFKSDDLYLSYWIKFSDNFDFSKCGGKLPSLGGDYKLDNQRWKGRIMWRNGGSVQFYPELFGKEDTFDSDADRFWGDQLENNGSICTNKFSPYLSSPGWHNIELHYKFETLGQKDGYFEGWIDGMKVHKVTNSEKFGMWRPANPLDEITINNILISTFLGGSDLSDYAHNEDVYAWLDEFRVSKTRVNEYAKYKTITAFESENTTSTLVLYPNPSNTGVFQLKETKTWEVFTPTGLRISAGKGTFIDLSSEAKGMYLVKINDVFYKIIAN